MEKVNDGTEMFRVRIPKIEEAATGKSSWGGSICNEMTEAGKGCVLEG